VLVVQDFNRVTIEDTDHLASEPTSHGGTGKPESEESGKETAHRLHASRLRTT